MQMIELHCWFIVIMKQTEQRFQVFVRVRPYTAKQSEEISAVEQAATKKQGCKLSANAYNFLTRFHPSDLRTLIKLQPNRLQVVDNEYKSLDRRYRPYYFNQVFGPASTNSHIFNTLEKNIQRLFEGFNFTVLAYGITGSGKTYTVFGNAKQDEERGLCHLIYEYLFRRKKEIQTATDNIVSLKFSFFQVYNENVRDLLSSDSNKSLNIVEDAKGNTVVSDLLESPVNNLSQIYAQVQQGYMKRVLTSTNNNLYSSRSHALQLLQVEVENSNGYKNVAKLYIVDLAGSEKIQSSKNKCVVEGANINKSLLALANCITLLASSKSSNHIPYRDSKLTRILKQSLGGNANTLMVTCISPNPFLVEQTVTTLNYASRALGIQKKITRNVIQPQNKAKQNMFVNLTPIKNKQNRAPRRISEFDSAIVNKILKDIRENAVQKYQLQQLLKICKESHSFQIQGAITVNEHQRTQLQNILRSYLPVSAPLQQRHLNSTSKYNSERKFQRASLKFERRPRVNSMANSMR